MEKDTSGETLGCGSSQSSEITLNIQTTTGGNFSITVDNKNTVDQLKKAVSKKLKVSKDRICLLHRERQLRDGTLTDNGLLDGSRVILLPSVETGLLTQHPENSVMQALESLNDSQVNDFLSGKSPLNLTMRLGDHMMLIQLHLSTLNPTNHSTGSTSTSNKPRTIISSRTQSKGTSPPSGQDQSQALRGAANKSTIKIVDQADGAGVSKSQDVIKDSPSLISDEPTKVNNSSNSDPGPSRNNNEEFKSLLRKQDIETLQNAFEIFKSLAEMQEDIEKITEDSATNTDQSSKYSYESDHVMDSSTSSTDLTFEEQSPIKSLSNLVSSPLKSALQSSYPPVNITASDKMSCNQSVEKSVSINQPKYVPLPSSLKNNLIESLVEGCGSSEKNQQTNTPLLTPMITDPIAANLTSCLCSTFNSDYSCSTNCHPSPNTISKMDTSHNVIMETDFEGETDISAVKNILNSYSEKKQYSNVAEQGVIKISVDNGQNTVSEDITRTIENFHTKSDYNGQSTTSEDTICTISEKFHNKSDYNVQHTVSEDLSPHATIVHKKGDCLKKSGSSTTHNSSQEMSESTKNKRLHYLLHKTSKHINPVTQSKQKAFMQSMVNKHLKKKMQQNAAIARSSASNNPQPSTSRHETPQSSSNKAVDAPSVASTSKTMSHESSVFRVPKTTSFLKVKHQASPSSSVSDTKALIEASKNLTQTLKKFSKEVLTSKVDLANEETARAKIGQGAVIESMKHHGMGIYSGTFSGTLNPALQDRFGRPKRDISTIIHILNDLLCATPPQYRRGARITFEPTHSTSSSRRQRESRQQSNNSSCLRDQGYEECGCSRCSNVTGKCPYGECNGHYTAPIPDEPPPSPPCSCSPTPDDQLERSCACSIILDASDAIPFKKCRICIDKEKDKLKKNTSARNCKKCHANALALENSKTKCKLDQLRLVMQQKKQKREARKMKSAPYVTTNSNVTPLQNEAPSVIAEEIETLA